MMNRTTDGRGTETVVSMPQPFDLAPVMEASRPTLSAAAEMNGRIYETLAAFNTQYVSFVNRRLKEDFGMPGKFASCRSLVSVTD